MRSSWTNKLITAKDHASVQINIGHLDANGVYTGAFTTLALAGSVRAMVRVFLLELAPFCSLQSSFGAVGACRQRASRAVPPPARTWGPLPLGKATQAPNCPVVLVAGAWGLRARWLIQCCMLRSRMTVRSS